jgi:hypothetical protein
VETESTQVDGAEGGLRGWDLNHRDYWVSPAGNVRYVVKIARAAEALDTTEEALRARLRSGSFPGRKKLLKTADGKRPREEWIIRVRDINIELGIGDDLEWVDDAPPMANA